MNIAYSNHPQAIEIQTASFCNSHCTICPYSESSLVKPAGVMTMDLFKSLIDQISDWGHVRLIPYFNNEPFLDVLLIERLKYIAKNCRNADIEISTNMSMLDSKRQADLAQFKLKALRMSVFGFSENSHKKIMKGLDWSRVKRNLDDLASNAVLRSKVEELSLIMVEYPGIEKSDIELASKYCVDNGIKFEFWGFLDRAGNVKNFSNGIHRAVVSGCEQRRPLDRLHVTFDGKVVLCCMDWFNQYVLGDLNTQSMNEVWNSKKYNDIRRLIYSGTEKCPEICKRCKLSLC